MHDNCQLEHGMGDLKCTLKFVPASLGCQKCTQTTTKKGLSLALERYSLTIQLLSAALTREKALNTIDMPMVSNIQAPSKETPCSSAGAQEASNWASAD